MRGEDGEIFAMSRLAGKGQETKKSNSKNDEQMMMTRCSTKKKKRMNV